MVLVVTNPVADLNVTYGSLVPQISPAIMPSAFSTLTTSSPAGLGLLINANLSSSIGYIGTVNYDSNDSDINDKGLIPSNLFGATSKLPRMSLMVLFTKVSTLKSRIPLIHL